jgi:hypothetical protein
MRAKLSQYVSHRRDIHRIDIFLGINAFFGVRDSAIKIPSRG